MWKEGVEFRRMIQYIWLKLYDFAVTSYTEVWIEIINNIQEEKDMEVTSTRKCGLKFTLKILTILVSLSLPLHGSVE